MSSSHFSGTRAVDWINGFSPRLFRLMSVLTLKIKSGSQHTQDDLSIETDPNIVFIFYKNTNLPLAPDFGRFAWTYFVCQRGRKKYLDNCVRKNKWHQSALGLARRRLALLRNTLVYWACSKVIFQKENTSVFVCYFCRFRGKRHGIIAQFWRRFGRTHAHSLIARRKQINKMKGIRRVCAYCHIDTVIAL